MRDLIQLTKENKINVDAQISELLLVIAEEQKRLLSINERQK